MRPVLLLCGPFCQRKVLILIRSSDGKFSSGTFCSLRPVIFMDSLSVPLCSPFISAVRSSLQSVPTGLPAKSSHYGKNGPAENLRRHLSSQKQVSDKEREPVFPDEFSDGEIMTTTRNYFRKKVLAQGYIGENGNFLLAESPRAWST